MGNISNDHEGSEKPSAQLSSLVAERVVLEATGDYGNAAFVALSLHGLPVAAVNPRSTKHFAKAGLGAFLAAAPA